MGPYYWSLIIVRPNYNGPIELYGACNLNAKAPDYSDMRLVALQIDKGPCHADPIICWPRILGVSNNKAPLICWPIIIGPIIIGPCK